MKYRIKEFAPIHDIWLLQKRVFFLWINVDVGSKEKIESYIKENL